jgi:hypothetical protein
MKCVNDNCNVDPLESISPIVVTIDGDMACCKQCKEQYEKQKNHFFNVIVNDDDKFNKWLTD